MGEAYLGGTRRAVTKIILHPLTVKQIKEEGKDGYQSVQVTFAKNKTREIPFLSDLKPGDTLTPSMYIKPGTVVSIQGTTKGKGFAGVVKRYNFAGGFKTHGQSDRHRAPGSIGQGTTPGRVHKGKKMAGRMGSDTKSVKQSLVVFVSDNEVWVTGPVPGHTGSLVTLTLTGEKELAPLNFISGGLPKPATQPPSPAVDESPEASSPKTTPPASDNTKTEPDDSASPESTQEVETSAPTLTKEAPVSA